MLRRLLPFAVLLEMACVASGPAVRPDMTHGRVLVPDGPPSKPEEWAGFPARGSPSLLGEAIAAHAASWVGLRSLAGVSRQVPDDCTGLARLAYLEEGIDLLAAGAQRGENGVSAIYRGARETGAVHSEVPRPGDLVFFRETYDRNRDGQRNDGLTHVGIVEKVDGAGTVTFIHRAGSGVNRSHFNPNWPTARGNNRGLVLNEILRPRSANLRAYLTGELFAGYAAPERLR